MFMPGVDIVGAGPSVLAQELFVTRCVVLLRPRDWMAVCCPDVPPMVEEGGWVGVCSSCCYGTRYPSRNPGPQSLKCDDRFRSLEVSVRDVGAAAVCVRLFLESY